MSMEPQVRIGAQRGSFEMLEEKIDEHGRTIGLIKGPYSTSWHEIIRKHDTCPLSGNIWVSHDAWANNYACTECDYDAYYPLGD